MTFGMSLVAYPLSPPSPDFRPGSIPLFCAIIHCIQHRLWLYLPSFHCLTLERYIQPNQTSHHNVKRQPRIRTRAPLDRPDHAHPTHSVEASGDRCGRFGRLDHAPDCYPGEWPICSLPAGRPSRFAGCTPTFRPLPAVPALPRSPRPSLSKKPITLLQIHLTHHSCLAHLTHLTEFAPLTHKNHPISTPHPSQHLTPGYVKIHRVKCPKSATDQPRRSGRSVKRPGRRPEEARCAFKRHHGQRAASFRQVQRYGLGGSRRRDPGRRIERCLVSDSVPAPAPSREVSQKAAVRTGEEPR